MRALSHNLKEAIYFRLPPFHTSILLIYRFFRGEGVVMESRQNGLMCQVLFDLTYLELKYILNVDLKHPFAK